MPALLLALMLFAADDAGAGAAQAPEPPYPPGAPTDDYGLVSWCYGALGGYLELHDRAMPEVERIEKTWRRPGSSLKEDLQVYADVQTAGKGHLKLFATAMESAEKASPRPINSQGAAAVTKGRSTWAGASNLTKARLAQEWMSWSLPSRCVPTAERLQQRASLMGPAFDRSSTAVTEPAPESSPAPGDPVGDLIETPTAADTPAASPGT